MSSQEEFKNEDEDEDEEMIFTASQQSLFHTDFVPIEPDVTEEIRKNEELIRTLQERNRRLSESTTRDPTPPRQEFSNDDRELIFLIDNREVSNKANTHAKQLSARLAMLNVHVEERSLVAGDMLWIIRPKQLIPPDSQIPCSGVSESSNCNLEESQQSQQSQQSLYSVMDFSMSQSQNPVSSQSPGGANQNPSPRKTPQGKKTKKVSITTGEQELVLDYVLERKIVADLCNSLMDGRYYEQKWRLSRCAKKPVYILEGVVSDGDIKNRFLRFTSDSVWKAFYSIQISDKLAVVHTESLHHTVCYIGLFFYYFFKKNILKNL